MDIEDGAASGGRHYSRRPAPTGEGSQLKLAVAMLLLCCAAGTGTAFAASANSAWKNALKPKGKAGAEITLAKGGKALYGIVIPASASTKETKAAADLAQWLKEMTGAWLAITREDAPKAGGFGSKLPKQRMQNPSGGQLRCLAFGPLA